MVRSITLLATASFALTTAFALPGAGARCAPSPEHPSKGHIGRTVGIPPRISSGGQGA